MNAGTPQNTNYLEPGAYRQNQILEGLGKRIAGFCATHWDINAMWLLREDLHSAKEFLGDGMSNGEKLKIEGIVNILDQCIDSTQMPDEGQSEHLLMISEDLHDIDQEPAATDAGAAEPAYTAGIATARLETPPKAYWRQWSEDAPPAAGLHALAATPTGMNPMNDQTGVQPAPDGTAAGALGGAMLQRIYHLSDYDALSIELDQKLEKAGFDVELLSSDAELKELLQALPADMILVDAGYQRNAESINGIILDYKKQAVRPVVAVRLSEQPAGKQAGAPFDAVLNPADGAQHIAGKINQLMRFGKSEQFRVLIVEDDRSQAMFAEGILRTAEIGTKVLHSSENLLPTIESFKPDLILMDLHLPNASGIELTELIRRSEQFQNTPIVFLSGESDEDIQMDALEAGGDDFLTKPIRPRRLIAAVQNRIKRHRAMQAELAAAALAPVTVPSGLLHRADMLDLIRTGIHSTDKALLFVELNGFNLLRDRLGLTALEDLLKQFSALLVEACSPNPVARFGDGSFVTVYQGDCAETVLLAYGSKIRSRLMTHKFDALGQVIEARVQVGICHFGLIQSSDQLINTAERTARNARTAVSGVMFFKPQSSAEALREERIITLLSETGEDSRLSHVYQPIVAVAGGDEKQFQTLLRLRDDDGRTLNAAEFIPIAEKSNLVIALDRWSVAKAAETVVKRKQAGDDIKLFVSQSNLTLLEPGQIAWMKNMLKAVQPPDGSLVIEIRHDDALLNHQSIHDYCQALLHDSIQFCLSRYNPRHDESSLLDSLPITYLKLSQKFTAQSGKAEVREQIKALVDRAHLRGVEVIGHSIEDAQTAATLWMSGIDFIQGNLVQSANDHLEFGFDQSVL
jgi:EAL domain-containing protein (putative c-di-GMP-specific phosphodiesterase class I)/PleD family two-component response regulator